MADGVPRAAGDGRLLLAQQRYEMILATVRRYGAARVSDLVATLGVSEVTVRRDIDRLAGQGLLTRVHGGATLGTRSGPADADGRPAGMVIGMVVPSSMYYYPDVIRGAHSAATEAGARLVLHVSRYDALEDRTQIERLLAAGVDGLLVTPNLHGPDGPAIATWLRSLDVPLVLVERGADHDELCERDWVASDHALGAATAVRHLAGLGHRRIGLVLVPDNPTAPAVHRGYRRAADQLGLPPRGVSVFDAPRTVDDAQAILDRCARSKVDALLVLPDREAALLVQQARHGGLRVPDDLAVIAYDDEVAAVTDPPLTAVRPAKSHLGAAAVDLLVKRLHAGRSRPAHHLYLTPRLIVRRSCGATPNPEAG